ncbi:HesB-like protein [Haloimpatiens sp. FM7315]|uniref:HesB-like protein n=1 Tax=Haloimpatiens sp. FM7315 TaxID=3298609 RepID=UPI0035A2BFB1
MSIVKISDVAYESLKNYGKNSNNNFNSVRIFLNGFSCSGPEFNLALDDKNIGDVTEKINETVFLIEGNLLREFKGFEIKCPEENGLDYFTIEPFVKPECTSCQGCSGCNE